LANVLEGIDCSLGISLWPAVPVITHTQRVTQSPLCIIHGDAATLDKLVGKAADSWQENVKYLNAFAIPQAPFSITIYPSLSVGELPLTRSN